MLRIPKGPTVRKGFTFGNVTQYECKQALALEIKDTITVLAKSVRVPDWRDTFWKFRGCINPGSVRDPARLPYPATGPNDRAGTKIGCVYARLAWAIQLYWDVCLDGVDNAELIRGYLKDLRDWAAFGIDNCKLVGNPREKYWLETR